MPYYIMYKKNVIKDVFVSSLVIEEITRTEIKII